MRITALGHYVPTRRVGVEETLDLFRHYSRPLLGDRSLEGVMGVAAVSLDRMGFRQISVRAPDEEWYANYIEMTRGLIKKSGVSLNEIDKVIYVGVGRGYREPATAYQMASNLGIRHAECFDILDACSAWSHTLSIIEPHFATGRCEHVLVLSLEFNRSPELRAAAAPEGGAGVYAVRSAEELEWAVWGASVGEAGTATLLSKGEKNEPWFFDFFFDSDMHRYCGFTLPNYRDYDLHPMIIEEAFSGDDRFFAYGRHIGLTVKDHLTAAFKKPKVRALLEEAKVVIPHSISLAMYEKLFAAFGVGHKARYSFPECGNTVSCGVPLTLSKTIAAGEVRRGDRVLLTPSGSGAAYGVVAFRY